MDIARCTCPLDTHGAKAGVNSGCPFHGYSHYDPLLPYKLSFADKQSLRLLRIDPEDGAEIQNVRQADENKPINKPRLKGPTCNGE